MSSGPTTPPTTGQPPPGGAESQKRVEGPSKPLVFISHRTSDAALATAVAGWLKVASNDNIEIFQSSDGLKGISSGRSITEEIRNKVAEAAVMVVVYTD